MDRRAFLQKTTRDAASLLLVPVCASLTSCTLPVRSHRTHGGPRMEIPLARYPELEEEGGVVKILSADGGVFFLRRTASGHVCHSALCTHQSCVVEAFPRGYECPCHGSTYDAAGRNTGGPAPRPLPAYPSWREGDVVIVDLRGEDATTPREPTQGGKS